MENKIAACVNIIPGITSVYTWEGKVEEDSEVLLMIKTRTSRVTDLTEYVRKQHPYEVPEVISMKVMTEWIAPLTRLACFLFILYSSILRL